MTQLTPNLSFSIGVFPKVHRSSQKGDDHLWPQRTEPWYRQHYLFSARQCFQGVSRTQRSQGRQQADEGNQALRVFATASLMIQIDIIVDGKDAPPAPEAKKLSDRITYV